MAKQPRSNGGSTQDASDGATTSPLLQGSFTSGELAPALYARTDLAKFHSGAKFLQNFFVSAQGGVYNRAGTRYVGNANSTGAVRLIPFSFNTEQTYVLVFTALSIQLVSNGGFVTEDGTSATPAITITTPYAGSDLFQITYCQDADVITLCHPNYPPATLTRMSATVWAYAPISPGTKLVAPAVTSLLGVNNGSPGSDTATLSLAFQYAATAVKINPPDESALSNSLQVKNYDLGYSSDDVHNVLYWIPESNQACDYYNVYRYYNGQWAYCASTTGILATGGHGSVGSTLAVCWNDYNITPDTNIAPPNDTNPFFGAEFIGSIEGTLLVITDFISGSLATGDQLSGVNVVEGTTLGAAVAGASFLGSINGTTMNVQQVYSGTITIGDQVVGPGVPAGATISSSGSGTTVNGDGYYALSVGANLQNQNLMDLPSNGATYSVSISQTAASALIIDNQNYPAACGFFQQRAVFGGTNSAPQEFFTSATGNYTNFNIRQPLLDSDAITATLANNQVNQIRHIVSMNDMVVFTNSGAWKVSGQSNSGDVITPSNVVAIPQAYSGASYVPPIVVSPDILYVQEKATSVRDLAYNVYTNLYTGSEISELAIHLFRGYQIIDWCWAQEPWKIVWAVRNDGTLLGLTYQKEEDVCAWHHHVTGATLGPASGTGAPGGGGGGGGGGGTTKPGGSMGVGGFLNAGIGGSPPRPFQVSNAGTPGVAINFGGSINSTIVNVIDSINTGGTSSFAIGCEPVPFPLPMDYDPSVDFTAFLSISYNSGDGDYVTGYGTGTFTCETGTLTADSAATTWTVDGNGCVVGGCVQFTSFSGQAVQTGTAVGEGGTTLVVGTVTMAGPQGQCTWTGVRFPGATELGSIQSCYIQQDTAKASLTLAVEGINPPSSTGTQGGSSSGTASYPNYDTSYSSAFLSVASVTEATLTGEEDVVYLAVGRVLQGSYVITIERMQSRILGVGDSDITQAWFVDCGLQYSNNGTLTNTVSGLDYLEGQTVAILADGKVQPQQVVPTGGTITIPIQAAVITVGLPVSAQMETLPIDAGSPTIQGKYKRLTHCRVFVYNTRGLQVGPNTPEGPQLVEVNARWGEPWGSPPSMFTGQQLVHLPGTWDPYGSMWVEQNYPLPASVLGIEPWVSLGE